jgi:hypothetical protein
LHVRELRACGCRISSVLTADLPLPNRASSFCFSSLFLPPLCGTGHRKIKSVLGTITLSRAEQKCQCLMLVQDLYGFGHIGHIARLEAHAVHTRHCWNYEIYSLMLKGLPNFSGGDANPSKFRAQDTEYQQTLSRLQL